MRRKYLFISIGLLKNKVTSITVHAEKMAIIYCIGAANCLTIVRLSNSNTK